MNDSRIGQDFGDYIVTRKIAEGGMGAVYLAEHPSGMRKVVKFMLAECLKEPSIRQRFEDECLAAKRLKGRAGIVDIDSFGVRNGEMYLVMEYLDGVTLDAHIRQNGRLTPHHTFHIMVQILRALGALHSEGIIHRDLKPSNVFVRQTDERPYDVKLIDFGIVHDKRSTKAGELRTRQGQMIGTPGYMATEQYGRADRVTEATDIFACAVIVWEMLTGQLPWGIAENEFAQHDRQLHQTPIWPQDIPLPHAEGWVQVLQSSLVPEPTQRPSTAQVFALLLAERLAPVPPYVPGGVEMVSKLAPRLLQNVPPELETVRHANAQHAAPMFWPPRGDANSVSAAAASGGGLDMIPVSAVSQMPSAATAHARPVSGTPNQSVPQSPATTLSASNGVSVVAEPSATATPKNRLAIIGLGTALAVGAITFGVIRFTSRQSTKDETPPPSAATQPAQASVPTPIDAGVVPDAFVEAPHETVVETAAPTPPPSTTTNAEKSSEESRKTTTVRSSTPTATKRPTTTTTQKHNAASGSNAGSAAAKKPFDLDGVKE